MLTNTQGAEVLLRLRAHALMADGRRQPVDLRPAGRTEGRTRQVDIWGRVRQALAAGRGAARPSVSPSG